MGQPIKIYVGNIPQSARNSELKELFEKFGKVVECDILKEFAFVHMDDTNDAKAAIAGLNDSLWKGARVRVELSTTKSSKGEPSQRHKYGDGDLSRSLRRRSRDRRSPPSYARSSAYSRDMMRDSRSSYDSRGGSFGPSNGGGPYGGRSNDMRGGAIRDSRYGPPPRSRPYPDGYDRRGYPDPRGAPLPPRDYPFHPASYREPLHHRDHHHRSQVPYDPYGRVPMAYGQPMPYYRGPPPMPGSRYDYPPGYPSSRPSRYSPPPMSSSNSRDMYREKDMRDISPPIRRALPRTMSSPKRRHHSSDQSRSPSPITNHHQSLAKRNGHNKTTTSSSSKHDRSSSRSQSPPPIHRHHNHHHHHRRAALSQSRSPSPSKARNGHRKSKDESSLSTSKSKRANSSNSSSSNSSINEPSEPRRSRTNGHKSPPQRSHKKSHKRAASSSVSRSRSRSSNLSIKA